MTDERREQQGATAPPVQARTRWHEARDNLSTLATALHLELEAAASDVPIGLDGTYTCDVVARERQTGHTVVIENQLGASDHRHLGQVLTYAAGAGAQIVVWVAARLVPDHRHALDWLNVVTPPDTAFYGVEVDLGRGSGAAGAALAPAPPVRPQFRVVVWPDSWPAGVVDECAFTLQPGTRAADPFTLKLVYDPAAADEMAQVRVELVVEDDGTTLPIGRSSYRGRAAVRRLYDAIRDWGTGEPPDLPELVMEQVVAHRTRNPRPRVLGEERYEDGTLLAFEIVPGPTGLIRQVTANGEVKRRWPLEEREASWRRSRRLPPRQRACAPPFRGVGWPAAAASERVGGAGSPPAACGPASQTTRSLRPQAGGRHEQPTRPPTRLPTRPAGAARAPGEARDGTLGRAGAVGGPRAGALAPRSGGARGQGARGHRARCGRSAGGSSGPNERALHDPEVSEWRTADADASPEFEPLPERPEGTTLGVRTPCLRRSK